MKRIIFALTCGLMSLIPGALMAAQGQFVANVTGTETSSGQNAKGANVIIVQSVTAKTIFEAFGVTSKNYALVFDANLSTLNLIPLRGSDGLPAFEILKPAQNYEDYNSASPLRFISVDSLQAGANAGGTDFDGLTGAYIITFSESAPGVTKAASAIAVGPAPNSNKGGTFNLKISTSRAFTQAP